MVARIKRDKPGSDLFRDDAGWYRTLEEWREKYSDLQVFDHDGSRLNIENQSPIKEYDKQETDTALAKRVREWVNESSGWFTTQELDIDLNISAADKGNRRIILHRLKEDGFIEQHKKENKRFRRIDKSIRLIDLKSAKNRTPLDLELPLGIEKFVNVYPRNIIVIAGAPDSGKTAWLLNFIYLNQDNFSISYFNSEMGGNELANRLEKFVGIELDDWRFEPIDKSSDFADVIREDDINLIDYLEISSDFSEIAGYIRAIYDRLNSGIAIIAIQKNSGARLGRGGSFSLEKARLYLSMDNGICNIVKAKNWVDPEFNPNGLQIKFKLKQGCNFIIDKEGWHHPY